MIEATYRDFVDGAAPGSKLQASGLNLKRGVIRSNRPSIAPLPGPLSVLTPKSEGSGLVVGLKSL